LPQIRHHPIRTRLHHDCIARQEQCLFVNWISEADTLERAVTAMEQSWFSFQGEGDFAIRGALYQAFVSMSIPVFGDDDFLNHVPFSDLMDYKSFTVILNGSGPGGFMDTSSPAHKENVIDILQQLAFNQTSTVQMLGRLHGVRHVMQFALNPNHDLLRFDQMHMLQNDDDAFTFSIKALMRRICKRNLEKCQTTLKPKR
jgi:hypothetical protein